MLDAGDLLERVLTVLGRDHGVSIQLERVTHRLAQLFFVLHDQHRVGHRVRSPIIEILSRFSRAT
jgi:hypothetical protein